MYSLLNLCSDFVSSVILFLFCFLFFFFFNDTATTEIYTLSLHDALPISKSAWLTSHHPGLQTNWVLNKAKCARSEEHTSELQSRQYLVCRLLLEKKKQRSYQ